MANLQLVRMSITPHPRCDSDGYRMSMPYQMAGTVVSFRKGLKWICLGRLADHDAKFLDTWHCGAGLTAQTVAAVC